MNAHGVEVLDRADHDHVVRVVAHHLELELFPAFHRLLDQHLVRRRLGEAVADDRAELVGRARRAASRAAQREGRPDDERQADLARDPLCVFERPRALRARHLRPDLEHRPLEEIPVLRDADRLSARSDQLDRPLVQDPGVGERERKVQTRLPADRGKERVGPLPFDDPLQKRNRERLDVRRVRELRVGHDRRRVRVDEDDPVSLAAKRADRLRPGVVELAGLPDDDRARSDDEDLLDVRSFGHRGRPRSISGRFEVAAKRALDRAGG